MSQDLPGRSLMTVPSCGGWWILDAGVAVLRSGSGKVGKDICGLRPAKKTCVDDVVMRTSAM